MGTAFPHDTSIVKNNSITACGFAALSLVISGLVVVVYFLAVHWQSDSGGPGRMVLAGADFAAVIGSANVRGDRLSIGDFEGDGSRSSAVVTARRSFDASEYRYLSLDFRGNIAGLEAKLFWKPLGVDGFFQLPIVMPYDGDVRLDMGGHGDWQGKISELGVVLTRGGQPSPVDFGGLILDPPGVLPAARQLLAEWSGFRGFSYSSINSLPATVTPGVLSPVPLAGSWMIISLLLLSLGRRAGLAIPGPSFLLALLVPWIVLDLLWQRELSTQRDITGNLFAGKSMAERHEVDIDREQYRYARELEMEALPSEPVRLFILHNSYSHNLDRLKMQYYLLPHNIYNLGPLPPEGSLGEGDYLLVLGGIPGVGYNPKESLLQLGGGVSVPVTLKHTHLYGSLYLIGASHVSPSAVPTRAIAD